MPDDQKLDRLRDRIADHCVDIEDMFTREVKVTCIVRVPGNTEGDVLVTNDTLAEVLGVIERSRTRTPTGPSVASPADQ